jgi:hypothetical protein
MNLKLTSFVVGFFSKPNQKESFSPKTNGLKYATTFGTSSANK